MTDLEPPREHRMPAQKSRDDDFVRFSLPKLVAIFGLIAGLLTGAGTVTGGVWAVAQLVGRLDTLSTQLAELTKRLDKQEESWSGFWKERWPSVETALGKVGDNVRRLEDYERRLRDIETLGRRGEQAHSDLSARVKRIEERSHR